jgi:hypothetical protein
MASAFSAFRYIKPRGKEEEMENRRGLCKGARNLVHHDARIA